MKSIGIGEAARWRRSSVGNESHRQSNEGNRLLQELGDKASQFQRLEKVFMEKGWRLYPLSDDELMVTMPKWGMSRVLPDFRFGRFCCVRSAVQYDLAHTQSLGMVLCP